MLRQAEHDQDAEEAHQHGGPAARADPLAQEQGGTGGEQERAGEVEGVGVADRQAGEGRRKVKVTATSPAARSQVKRSGQPMRRPSTGRITSIRPTANTPRTAISWPIGARVLRSLMNASLTQNAAMATTTSSAPRRLALAPSWSVPSERLEPCGPQAIAPECEELQHTIGELAQAGADDGGASHTP